MIINTNGLMAKSDPFWAGIFVFLNVFSSCKEPSFYNMYAKLFSLST